MKSVIAFVFVSVLALLQIGCSGGQIGRIAGGAIGGGGGAAIGKAADKNGYLGPVLGGAIGGAVGAETGNAIGSAIGDNGSGNQVRYTSVGESPALEAARTGETVVVEEGAWKHEYVPQAPDSHGTVRVKQISSINGEIKRTKILRIRP